MFARLGPRPKTVPILGAQAFAHGMICSFTIIPATGIFLSTYGPDHLPYVYLLVALTGFVTAPFFARAMGKWSVATVARPVLTGLIMLQVGCWLVLANSSAVWPSIILEVLFPVTLQIGFVFLGTQAGRLLTMREMKAWFSVIASGFSVGFLLSSLVAPLIIDVFGGTEHILPFTAAATAVLLVLATLTQHRHPGALAAHRPPARQAISEPAPRAGAPVRTMIVLLFGYQVLSALGTQFAEFLLYDRAAARYSTSEDLARFTSHFNVGLNIFELLFLFFLAGPLLARFGLRLGLFANPIVVTVAIIGALLASSGAGVGSLALFIAVGAARIGDIALTNSTTRTATNTAYQALPVGIRPAVQARAEGIGVPGAIGLSGVILLLVVHAAKGGVLTVIGVTIAICALWLVSTGFLYRRYRHQLRENLGHRMLTPHLIPYGDSETDGVIDLLLHDGLDSTTPAVLKTLHESPTMLAAELARLRDEATSDPRELARLTRFARHHDPALVDVLVDLTDHPSRHVRAVALQQLATCIDSGDPRCAQVASDVIDSLSREAAEIVHALSNLPEGRGIDAVRDALLDEARTAKDCALYALAFVLDGPTMHRARQWLNGDDRQRATAVESIEVNTPTSQRSAVMAILELDHDLSAAERGLRAGVTPWPSTHNVLPDLRDDPRHVWNEPWLATCAGYALDSASVV
jgi:hypothetical protein